MNRKNIISILLLTFLSINTIAQENKSENVVAFINPQYLFTSGIRVDIDFRKPHSNKWWVLSPYYYRDGSDESFLNRDDNEGYGSREYKSMTGYGLGISRKVFLRADETARGLYASVGFTYRYFDISGENRVFYETIGDDGLPYFELTDMDYSININSYNGSLIVGSQFNPFSRFYIDLYFGFGVRYSTHSSPEDVAVEYDRGNIDYGYSGTQFIGGFRFGITLF